MILSATPSLVGGTLGQLVEHDQDKNIIIIYTSGGVGSVTGGAGISHTHGSINTVSIAGSVITNSSASNGLTLGIPAWITTAPNLTNTHGSINTVSVIGSLLTNSSASSGLTLGVPNWLTTAAQSIHTHDYAGTGISATGALATLNSNGLAINVTNTAAGDGYNIVAAGTQTGATKTTILFSNANGVSFGMSGGSRITASYIQSTHAHPYINASLSNVFLTTARASSDAIGLVTAQTNVTWTADSRGLSINAEGYAGTTTAGTNVGLTVNSLGIRASVDTAGMTAAGDGVNILAAGSVTAGTVQTILFNNSNGISFGMDTDSTAITAQHNAYSATSMFSASFLNTAEPHVRQLVAGATSYTSGTAHLVGTNNITVTYDGSSILLSGADTHAVQTGVSGIAGSGASTVTAGTVQFANSNNVSFGLNGSTMTASIPAVSAISGINVSDALFTSGTVSFSNANNISFGSSGAGVISASISFPAQTVQPVAISDSATSFTFETLSLGTENGLTLYHSASSIVGSYTVPSATVFSNSNNVSFGLNGSTITASASIEATTYPHVISINGTSGELSLSVGTNLTLSPLNGSTYSLYGPANILNSLSIGGNTGTTGSSNITGGGFVLAGGSNITLSQSNNTISVHASGGIRLGGSDTTYESGTVMLSGEANLTVGTTVVGGIQYFKLSAAGGTGTAAADGYNWLVAGSQTANTTGYVSFANSNGITFGMSDNSIITASHIYPSGVTTASTIGTDIVATLDTGGLSLGVPQFVTVPGTSTLYFGDSNGVTFGSVTAASATTITASIDPSAGGGSGFTTSSITGSVIIGTMDSGGLYLSVPNYMTTAMQSGASVSFARTGFSSSSTTGSILDGIHNTNGLFLAVPNYITTAMASNAGSRFIGTATAQSNVTWTANSNGLSLNANGYAGTGFTSVSRTGSNIGGVHNTGGLYLSIPNYLTTAMQSGDSASFARTGFTTGSTAGSLVAGTLSTNGLSLRVPQYITTVPSNSVVFAGGSNVTWGTSTTGNTTSVFLTAGGGSGGGVAIRGSGTSIASTGTVQFSNSNGVSFGLTGNTMTASLSYGSVVLSDYNNVSFGVLSTNSLGSTVTASASYAGGAADGGNILAAGGSTASSNGTVLFSNANGISFGFQSTTRVTASHNAFYTSSQLTNTFMNTSEYHIRAIGNTANSSAFRSGSVMLSGINLTVNTSSTGASQYLQISAPALGYLFFSNTNGHSWSSSINGVSTSIYIIT